jgi:hypothetical protein
MVLHLCLYCDIWSRSGGGKNYMIFRIVKFVFTLPILPLILLIGIFMSRDQEEFIDFMKWAYFGHSDYD